MKSMNWITRQECKDMFVLSKWNQTTTYNFAISRDFGTDYGICCWYTPQLNYTQIDAHTKENNLSEPDWGKWFMNVPKESNLDNLGRIIDFYFRGPKLAKTMGSPCCLILNHLTILITMRGQKA